MQAPLRRHLWYFISSSTEEDTSKIDHPPPTQREEVIPVQLKYKFEPVYTRLWKMSPRVQVEFFQHQLIYTAMIRGKHMYYMLHSRLKLNILIHFENQHVAPPQKTSYSCHCFCSETFS